jgi:hypothetical protein
VDQHFGGNIFNTNNALPAALLGNSVSDDSDDGISLKKNDSTSSILGREVVTFQLPSLKERSQLVANNPVATSNVFHSLINFFMEELVGLKECKDVRYTLAEDDLCRKRGLFGNMIAYYGPIEAQGRGTLHLHSLLWGGLNPNMLQKIASDPTLHTKLRNTLDTMVQAKVSDWAHELKLGQRMRNNEITYKPVIICNSHLFLPDSILWHKNNVNINKIIKLKI